MKTKKILIMIMSLILILSLVSCSTATTNDSIGLVDNTENSNNSSEVADVTESIESTDNSFVDTSEMFTDRDLEQTADLSDAVYLALENGKEINIKEEGVYVFTGSATNASIVVEVGSEEIVQLVLDNVSITNDSTPAINIKSGDKIFVTLTESENYMAVSGSGALDAVIYSKSDLVLNGLGTLEIVSSKGNGITSKDDLKITGGIYNITSLLDGVEANDSIRIYDGEMTITSSKDAIHSENGEDSLKGYIYIHDGVLNIKASDDAIHANSVIQIDGGEILIESCKEGIEATYIQINNGLIDLYATDDGINATRLSELDVVIEVNGGVINVVMASGDTDGFDANGDIYINGGTISVEAVSAFDSDGVALLNDGTVTVNGEEITEITQMQMRMDDHKQRPRN